MSGFIVWLIISAMLIIIDAFTASFMLVWFGISGFVAALLSALGVSLGAQVVVFLIGGLILAILLYPIAKEKFKVDKKTLLTREETYEGKVLKAEHDIEDKGSIKLDGVLWNAINEGSAIKKGEFFKILRLEGNKIVIEKVEEEK